MYVEPLTGEMADEIARFLLAMTTGYRSDRERDSQLTIWALALQQYGRHYDRTQVDVGRSRKSA